MMQPASQHPCDSPLGTADSGAAEEPSLQFHPASGSPPTAPDLARLAELPSLAVNKPAGASGYSSVSPAPTAVALCRDVLDGRRAPLEVLDATLARIADMDRFNAFVTLCPDRAGDEAAQVERAMLDGDPPPLLAGVPIAHKDIICTAGLRTAAGSRLLAGYLPEHDATVVRRLRQAGSVCVGKLNTHEFATGVTGTVSAEGPTLNPWNVEHVPGGSSCGSAAAVAAGLVCAATATDTGGSIRIPSACCGVIGLKPTYGRVSRGGVTPFAWSLDHVGPIARSVTDVAALLSAMEGPDELDPGSAASAPQLAPIAHDSDLHGVRFALPDALLDSATDPVAAAVRGAGACLEQLGATRVEIGVPPTLADAARIALAIFLAEGGAYHETALTRFPDLYQHATREFLSRARDLTGIEYVQAQRQRARLGREFAALFTSIDVFVCPTLPIVAPAVSAERVVLPDGDIDVRAALTQYTRPFNLTGLPALQLPCGFEQGLPVGLQVVGAAFREIDVLRVGAAFERATNWVLYPPGCESAS